jgi:hypothetical protein
MSESLPEPMRRFTLLGSTPGMVGFAFTQLALTFRSKSCHARRGCRMVSVSRADVRKRYGHPC